MPVLVYDGGCLFCSHFALTSELRSGIPDLQIRDGRADAALRAELNRRGAPLRDGAVLIDGDQLPWRSGHSMVVCPHATQ